MLNRRIEQSGTQMLLRVLTQDESELSRWKQDLQAAVQEGQQVFRVRTAELNKQLLLPAAEGRLLRPVKHQNLTGHLTKNKTVSSC